MPDDINVTMTNAPVLVTLILTFWFLGILTNVSFLVVVWRVKGLRQNSINSYLVNMAIADLFFLLTNKFFLLMPLSAFGHKFVLVGFAANIAPEIVTELMMPLVAYDWYKAICLPTQSFGMRCDNKAAIAYALISWVVSICVVVPMCVCLAFWGEHIYYEVKAMCLLPFLVCLILCTALYCLIIRRVNSEMVRLKEQPEVIQNSIMARNQIVKMLIANTAAFFILLLPGKVNVLYRFGVTIADPDAKFETHDIATWWILSEMLLLINSAINPIVYTVGSRRYRQALFRTFPCCFRCCASIDLATTFDDTTKEAVTNSKGKLSSLMSRKKIIKINPGVDSRELDTTDRGIEESIEKL